MPASLAIVLPVFGLIGLGYLARRFGLLTDRAGDGISDFVFAIAVPALIFRTLSRADIPAVQPWGYWISYFLGVAVVWTVAQVAAKHLFRLDGVSAVAAGFAAGQSNTVLMGIPMILKAYGEAGAVPLFLLVAIHLPITMTAATLLAEGRSASPRALARRLLGNPIVLAIFAGSAGRFVAAAIPSPAWQVLDLVSAAATPCSLIALGIALRRYGLEAGWRLPAMISGLKLVIHPLVVYGLTTRVFAMPPAWAGVAVLFAACPSGINAYLFAERYGQGVAATSSAIALSTALSLVTIATWLRILGVG